MRTESLCLLLATSAILSLFVCLHLVAHPVGSVSLLVMLDEYRPRSGLMRDTFPEQFHTFLCRDRSGLVRRTCPSPKVSQID